MSDETFNEGHGSVEYKNRLSQLTFTERQLSLIKKLRREPHRAHLDSELDFEDEWHECLDELLGGLESEEEEFKEMYRRSARMAARHTHILKEWKSARVYHLIGADTSANETYSSALRTAQESGEDRFATLIKKEMDKHHYFYTDEFVPDYWLIP